MTSDSTARKCIGEAIVIDSHAHAWMLVAECEPTKRRCTHAFIADGIIRKAWKTKTKNSIRMRCAQATDSEKNPNHVVALQWFEMMGSTALRITIFFFGTHRHRIECAGFSWTLKRRARNSVYIFHLCSTDRCSQPPFKNSLVNHKYRVRLDCVRTHQMEGKTIKNHRAHVSHTHTHCWPDCEYQSKERERGKSVYVLLHTVYTYHVLVHMQIMSRKVNIQRAREKPFSWHHHDNTRITIIAIIIVCLFICLFVWSTQAHKHCH